MNEGSPKAQDYRKLAADARAEAARVTVPQAKQVLLRLAYVLDANAQRRGTLNAN